MKNSRLNICRSVGAVIQSSIEKIPLEDAVNRESLGRFPADNLFDGLYDAAANSSNPNTFLSNVRFYRQSFSEEGNKKLILEFYK